MRMPLPSQSRSSMRTGGRGPSAICDTLCRNRLADYLTRVDLEGAEGNVDGNCPIYSAGGPSPDGRFPRRFQGRVATTVRRRGIFGTVRRLLRIASRSPWV